MSKLLLRGGRLLDPASGRDERGDLLLENGVISAAGAWVTIMTSISGKAIQQNFRNMATASVGEGVLVSSR